MIRKLLLCLVLLFSITVPVHAEEPETSSEELTVQEVYQTIEYNLQIEEPLAIYEVNPDDYNGSTVSMYAINGDVYDGSINSTALSLWNGLLSNNVGKDYLAYRGGQYDYYIIFGEDIVYNNGVFSGSGTYHHLYTYGNAYSYDVGNDSFSIRPADNYVYTNVSDYFPALENERGYLYEQIQTVVIIALLGFSVLRWIFIGK